MKKDKNKGKKLLAAVGIVVAAGLSTGYLNATQLCVLDQAPIATPTVAKMVATGGTAHSFDELCAKQLRGDGLRQEAVRSGQDAIRHGVSNQQRQPAVRQRVSRIHPDAIITPEMVLDTIQEGLADFCAQLLDADPNTKGTVFTLDNDLTSELGMSESQLKELKAIIEEYYGVEVSYNRFRLNGQLNTLRLISEYIFKLKTVWDRPEKEPYR